MSDHRLLVDYVVTPGGVLDFALIIISSGSISDIRPRADDQRGIDDAERVAGWVVPGFVDTHCHGGGGHDFATTDARQALAARDFHRRHGSTSILASLVADEIDTLGAQLGTLSGLVADGDLAGIHLEGPFLSPAKPGAHDPALLRHPEPRALDQLLAGGRGAVSMITIAPELPHGMAAIDRLVGDGVTAAVGHTDADAEMIKEALDHGATVATHLFNAMRPIHHREPGPVPTLLDDPRVVVELIADGVHLHDDVLRLAIAAAGPDRVALITDAMLATGMADGRYRLGTMPVEVADGRARVVEADGSAGAIAGSTLTMAAAYQRLIGLGLPHEQVARMAATTPARVHRLNQVGTIETGRLADLCVVDDRGGLQRVMARGEWVA
jgi:N-acetylglucosamine-6-phosphate deacetylase